MNRGSLKARRLWPLGVGLGALMWLSWFWDPTHRDASYSATTGDTARRSSRLEAPSTHALSLEHQPARAADTTAWLHGKAPTIHGISVDKQAVCRGEENFVNVRATGPDGSDAHLRVSLRGTSDVGSRIPFRLYSDSAAAMPRVLVEGRGGAEVTAPLPPVKVKNCEVQRTAAIELIALGASTNDWRFAARVTSGTFVPQSYEWDFGDGTHSVSTEAEIVHSYRFRSQDKRYSTFLIALTMRNSSGELLRTTRAFGIPNPAFGRLVRHGEVAVFAERRNQEGGQELTRLYHAYHAPVRIENVALKIRSQDGRREDFVGNYSPESIGVREVPPGEPAEVTLMLANMKLPDIRPLLLVFEVKGSTNDGIPASGIFSAQLL